ncbi:MAG: class I SAM-dependent DNA methyltransferase [Candidatus Contendobacter sp.]|nr:class I SAM-dependent DNA methyltransferase [Candidatus Contendobacter sp.]MDS4057386.1 class I SAM-dependent DNA methyltransferase [Candidatus Contendobacter sp.]
MPSNLGNQINLFSSNESSATLGFETVLWQIADKLRGHLDVSQYKYLVLGLIFLKSLADLVDAGRDSPWILPDGALWSSLLQHTDDKEIAARIDEVLEFVEKHNPALRGALPKDFQRSGLKPPQIQSLLDALAKTDFSSSHGGGKDILGRVYEYFLGQFARAEGNRGGEFYTPHCVVNLLVKMLAPTHGVVYDPCCGSGGMFVQSQQFAEEHGSDQASLRLFGQESNPATWRLARINMAIRGLNANLGQISADTFAHNLHDSLVADYIIANPPFNQKDWGGKRLRSDKRWKYGTPPEGNANYAWIQHFISHLSQEGIAGFVLANGALTSNTSGEGHIRRLIIENDLIDCMVGLPGQLFYSTQIPVSIWFIAKDKSGIGQGNHHQGFRDRRGECLFVDARSYGVMVDRTHRELTETEINKIVSAYHNWRGDGDTVYNDIPGFCRSVSREEVGRHKYALVPGRYVGFDRACIGEVNMDRLRIELTEIKGMLLAVGQSAKQTLNLLEELVDG